MSANEVVVPVISSIFSLFSGGAIWSYWRERRVDNAKSKVAEQTVDIEIDTNRLALVERQMRALTESFNTERESFQSTIRNLRQDLEDERVESARKDERIGKLVTQVDEIQKALDLVKAELASAPKPSENGS